MLDTYGIIDTACTVHAVSLTPDAWCMQCQWHHVHKIFFEQLQKVKIICTTALVCKKIKNGVCSVNDTACTKIFSNNFKKLKSYTKQRWYVKINKNACGVNDTTCTVHAVSKTIISRRIWSIIQKGFSPWIRGPGGIVWWKKNENRKSRDTVPLRYGLWKLE
jgi:hypothetical protein